MQSVHFCSVCVFEPHDTHCPILLAHHRAGTLSTVSTTSRVEMTTLGRGTVQAALVGVQGSTDVEGNVLLTLALFNVTHLEAEV